MLMDLQNTINHFLDPGHLFVTSQSTSIGLVVGSGVAVSLYDPVRGTGGMCHFVHPSTRDRENATPRFGNVAVSILCKMMIEEGSDVSDLVAQVFGGGYPKEKPTQRNLGVRSVQVAEKVLHRYGIAIASADIGGTIGRKVIFDTASGSIIVIRVPDLRHSDWYPD